MENFAQSWQVNRKSTDMEPSNPFHTLVKMLMLITLQMQKNRTLDLPLKNKKLKLKLASLLLSSKFYDSSQ